MLYQSTMLNTSVPQVFRNNKGFIPVTRNFTLSKNETDSSSNNTQSGTINHWIYVSIALAVSNIVLVVLCCCWRRWKYRLRSNSTDDENSDTNFHHYTHINEGKSDKDTNIVFHDIDKDGYSLVREDSKLSIERTSSGYIDVNKLNEVDTFDSGYTYPANSSDLPKRDTLREKTPEPCLMRKTPKAREVSCGSVYNEYNLNSVPDGMLDDDFVGTFSRFHTYYSSMNLEKERVRTKLSLPASIHLQQTSWTSNHNVRQKLGLDCHSEAMEKHNSTGKRYTKRVSNRQRVTQQLEAVPEDKFAVMEIQTPVVNDMVKYTEVSNESDTQTNDDFTHGLKCAINSQRRSTENGLKDFDLEEIIEECFSLR